MKCARCENKTFGIASNRCNLYCSKCGIIITQLNKNEVNKYIISERKPLT